jgi:hypothetical protein
MPSGSGYPSTGPTAIELRSPTTTTNGTTTITFATAITPADHIYFDDFDNSETATLTFRDNSGTIIDPSAFRINLISTTFPTGFSTTAYSNRIEVVSGSAAGADPLLEIIPTVPVKSISLTYLTPVGTFGMYFGRNIPVLTQALSGSTITRGRSLTLTYTLSGINNNPISDLGFVNNLPSGWKIAAAPATTGTTGTFSTPANGSSVSLSGVNNAFASSNGVTSMSWTVDVSNANDQMNSSCGANPAAFTNRSTNFVSSSTVLANNISPVCFTVTAPLPLELTSFSAMAESCAVSLRWESAFESQLGTYEMERSADGQRWESVGTMAAENKPVSQRYSYTDRSAPQGNLMYRLRIHDLNGTQRYSQVAAARLACGGDAAPLSFMPNPASGTVRCNLGTQPLPGSHVQLVLSDITGRRVAMQPAQGWSGAVAQFDVPMVTPGIYLVQVLINGAVAGTGKLSIF